MYQNVIKEMKEKQITLEDLAMQLPMDLDCLNDKIQGKQAITLEECMAVKKALKSRLDIYILFIEEK